MMDRGMGYGPQCWRWATALAGGHNVGDADGTSLWVLPTGHCWGYCRRDIAVGIADEALLGVLPTGHCCGYCRRDIAGGIADGTLLRVL